MPDWYLPSTPEKIKAIPWLSASATAFLESLLQPEFHVIEHGSGGSTLWFASRVKSVTASENDSDWSCAVRERAGTNVIIANLDDLPGKFSGDCFDLLFIDGEPVENRRDWLRAVPALVKRGGYVVLDNANRPEYKKERAELLQCADLIKIFDGNQNGTRYLVTEFYRLRL